MGVVVVLGLYLFVLWRALETAQLARDRVGAFLAAGIAAVLAFQVVYNVAMVAGLVPVKGLPLPLMSYGGSSVSLRSSPSASSSMCGCGASPTDSAPPPSPRARRPLAMTLPTQQIGAVPTSARRASAARQRLTTGRLMEGTFHGQGPHRQHAPPRRRRSPSSRTAPSPSSSSSARPTAGIVGNIYKGRVTRVLPGMQSAFVDVGLERDAFLYVADVFEELDENLLTPEEQGAATDAAAHRGPLHEGQDVLVQVVKEPLGHQGRAHHLPRLPARPLPGLHAHGRARRRLAQDRGRRGAPPAEDDS